MACLSHSVQLYYTRNKILNKENGRNTVSDTTANENVG